MRIAPSASLALAQPAAASGQREVHLQQPPTQLQTTLLTSVKATRDRGTGEANTHTLAAAAGSAAAGVEAVCVPTVMSILGCYRL